jgi:excisionase family DNA binding protein
MRGLTAVGRRGVGEIQAVRPNRGVDPAPTRWVPRARSLGCRAIETRGSRPSLKRPGEVAVDLAVSRTWVYDAANAGRIPSIRIGGEDGPLRFVEEDVDRWIDEARKAWQPGGGSVATRSPGDEDS